MGAMYLIRHAQASFGKKNYDELSELGHKQASILGQRTQLGQEADIIFSGEMTRHRQTAEGFLNGASKTHKIGIEAGLNEFDHEEIIARYDVRWQDKERFHQYIQSQKNPRKSLHHIFSHSVERWTAGLHDDEYRESWPHFIHRVTAALDTIKAQAGYSKNIIVFTSGGPISAIVGSLLKINTQHTFAINENLVNTGITRLLYNEEKISLSYLNNYSHLEINESDLVSFR